MKRVLIFAYFLLSILSYGKFLVTNSTILFYYDDNRKIVTDIKGDISANVDISSIEVGIIKNNRHYYLREYFNETIYTPGSNAVENYGKIEDTEFKVEVSLRDGLPNDLHVKVNFFNPEFEKENVKVVYHISPQKDNAYTEKKKNGVYSYDEKIFFQDSTEKGKIFFSNNSIISGNSFRFMPINERRPKWSDGILFFISDLVKLENTLVIRFGGKGENLIVKGNGSDVENHKYNMETKVLKFRDIEKKELVNLDTLIQREKIPQEIAYNNSKTNYITQLTLEYFAYNYGIIDRGKLNKLQGPTKVDKLFFDYIYLKLLKQNIVFENERQKIVDTAIKDVNKFFDELYSNGRIDEIYYLVKVLDYLIPNVDSSAVAKLKENRDKIVEMLEKDYFNGNYLKNSRDALYANYRNLKYMDIFPVEKQKKVILSEYSNYYSKDYELLLRNGTNPVRYADMEYNFIVLNALYSAGEKTKGDRLLGKLENLIESNKGFIPLRYEYQSNNEDGIYAEMIAQYFWSIERSK